MHNIAGLSQRFDEATSTIAVLNLIANSNIDKSDFKSGFNLILLKCDYNNINAFVFGSLSLALFYG